ncbi:MAG: prolyl oligopeptidase family serine peptidase [Nannocystaceae bacterium]|nr:prolyl oligopeptidase family serine peptidase [Nannocystaceae bacterium]
MARSDDDARLVPWGCWDSPLAPERMAVGARRLSAPRFVGDAMVVCESRPAERGRTTLIRCERDGRRTALVPAPHDVGTRAYEYGGRAWVEHGARIVFADRGDGRLWLRREDGSIVPLSAAGPWRFAEPIVDARRDRILAVAEALEPGAPRRVAIVAVALGDGAISIVCEGADFYAAPTLDHDGATLAWVQWDHPHMPWDASALWCATLDAAGRPLAPRHVAGDASASAQQPGFARDGALLFLWERDGAWTLWRDTDRGAQPVLRDAADRSVELGAAMWNLGLRTWGLLDDDTVIAAGMHEGQSRVVRLSLRDGTLTTLATRGRTIGHLVAGEAGALVLQGWDGRGTAVTWIDRDGDTLARVDVGLSEGDDPVLPAAWWSEPEPIRFATSDGDHAHAWLYRPHAPGHRGPEHERPPLVVMAHGGPTGCAIADAHLAVQFWTTRGFAVLDVNYRGSTGFGRAYRERLRGMWGVRDVADCVAAARHVAAAGVVDPRRMIIRGGSAGGFTVLCALAFHDVFAAGASHYGVADVESLVHDTHAFESHYDRFLFGEHDDPRPLWRERSPLFAADRIAVPVIFFQGSDDPVVPAAQTEAMVEALRARGVEVEYHRYEGEGHGLRRAESIADSWARELAFHRRVLGLATAG